MDWRTRLDSLRLDVRYSLRTLRQHRGTTIVACLSLAIGIGATTAAFSVYDALVLRPLPVPEPHRLSLIATRNAGTLRSMSHPSFLYLRDRASAVAGLAAFRSTPVTLGINGTTERVTALLVSGNYFDVLGVSMARGTAIRPEDDVTPRSGGARGLVGVLSHAVWRQRFNLDPGVIGQTVRVNDQAVTIVGVAPAPFNGTVTGSMPGVYLPMMFAPHVFDGPWLENPRNLWLRLIARMKPSVPAAQAQTEMTRVFRQFFQDVVVAVADTELTRRRAREAAIVLEPGGSGLLELGDTAQPTATALIGLAALVLITACVNVAGLTIARTERRRRDTAISLALGAGQARIWVRYLTESLAVAAAGIGLGLLFASWMSVVLARTVTLTGTLDLRLDVRVLGIAIGSGVLAALAIGVLTGWSQSRVVILRSLKGEDARGGLRLRKVLIAGQLAFSAAVLVVAVLLTQTLAALQRVDVGFAREHVMVASIAPVDRSAERRGAFYARVLDDIRRIPGVQSAALAGNAPLEVNTGWTIKIPRPGGHAPEPVEASVMRVSPDYFETMAIPLRRGRAFEARDLGSLSNPVIVNENFARAYLAGADPIGFRFQGNGTMTFEIVGVVRDSAAFSLRDLDNHMIYVPGTEGVLHVRSAIAPGVLQAAIEDVVRRVDPHVPVFDVRTIEQLLDRFLLRERTLSLLSSLFGLLALALVAVGVYGLIANSVTRRTKELGIRIALGARAAEVVRLILRDAVSLLAIGALAGIPLAIASGRVIRTLLFGVDPLAWSSLTVALALLALIGGIAAWIPARRAARVDPLVALKAE